MSTLAERIDRRREIRAAYAEVFAEIPGTALNPIGAGHEPNHWLTCVTIDPAEAGFSREELRLHLEAANIEARPLWKPMHLQPVFSDAPRRIDGTSEALFEIGLCLPSGSSMTHPDITRVTTTIAEFATSRR